MANVKDIISNPVFYAPQTTPQEGAETKSEILYANKFSGLDEVPMSGELLELFTDNALNLTDTNFRLQLQHILEEYDSENGPWYIDGVNGIIHVHNRKIANSAFVYRYQDENGEVLRVQVTTNWTTGTTSGTVASSISRNKTKEIIRFDLPTPDFSIPISENPVRRHRNAIWLEKDNVGRNIEGPGHYPDYYQLSHVDNEGRTIDDGVAGAYAASQHYSRGGDIMPLANPYEAQMAENIRVQREVAAREARYDEIQSSQNAGANVSRRNSARRLNSFIATEDEWVDQFYDNVMEEVQKGATTPEMAEERVNVVKKIYNGKPLTEAEQRVANTQIWLDDPEVLARVGKVEAPRSFTASFRQRGNSVAPYTTLYYNYGTAGTVVNATTIEDLSRQLQAHGITEGASNGWGKTTYQPHQVLEDVQKVIRQANQSSRSNGGSAATRVGNIQVKINGDGTYTVKVQAIGTYAPVVTLTDIANFRKKRDTPGVGGSKRARALALVNSMRNRAKKTKHKEIEVQMLVVGRPSLCAGQYIDILNIGNRYSGQWYIKTCVHQLDSNGYTCSLTLKKNQATPQGKAISLTRNSKGATQTTRYEVHTQAGNLSLSATDLSYANRLALEGKQRSFQNFVYQAIWAQQNGQYGEGLMRATNMQPVHMDGRENPDLQYERTDAGKAAAEGYSKYVQARRKQASFATQRLSNKKKKRLW